jgi:hypothetical protein
MGRGRGQDGRMAQLDTSDSVEKHAALGRMYVYMHHTVSCTMVCSGWRVGVASAEACCIVCATCLHAVALNSALKCHLP